MSTSAHIRLSAYPSGTAGDDGVVVLHLGDELQQIPIKRGEDVAEVLRRELEP